MAIITLGIALIFLLVFVILMLLKIKDPTKYFILAVAIFLSIISFLMILTVPYNEPVRLAMIEETQMLKDENAKLREDINVNFQESYYTDDNVIEEIEDGSIYLEYPDFENGYVTYQLEKLDKNEEKIKQLDSKIEVLNQRKNFIFKT